MLPRGSSLTSSRLAVRGAAAVPLPEAVPLPMAVAAPVAVAEESVAGPVAVAVAVPVAVSGFSCIVGVPVQAFGGGQPESYPKGPPEPSIRTLSCGYQGNCGIPGWNREISL